MLENIINSDHYNNQYHRVIDKKQEDRSFRDILLNEEFNYIYVDAPISAYNDQLQNISSNKKKINKQNIIKDTIEFNNIQNNIENISSNNIKNTISNDKIIFTNIQVNKNKSINNQFHIIIQDNDSNKIKININFDNDNMKISLNSDNIQVLNHFRNDIKTLISSINELGISLHEDNIEYLNQEDSNNDNKNKPSKEYLEWLVSDYDQINQAVTILNDHDSYGLNLII